MAGTGLPTRSQAEAKRPDDELRLRRNVDRPLRPLATDERAALSIRNGVSRRLLVVLRHEERRDAPRTRAERLPGHDGGDQAG